MITACHIIAFPFAVFAQTCHKIMERGESRPQTGQFEHHRNCKRLLWQAGRQPKSDWQLNLH